MDPVPPGQDADLDAKIGWVHRILQKFAPMLGLNPTEFEWFWGQAADRLHDVNTLVHGGTLRDGTEVPGLVATAAQLDRIEALLQNAPGKNGVHPPTEDEGGAKQTPKRTPKQTPKKGGA